jgi:hypothetical protein
MKVAIFLGFGGSDSGRIALNCGALEFISWPETKKNSAIERKGHT